MSNQDNETAIPSRPGRRDNFTATHWTQVAQAAERDGSVQAQQALEALCARYWPAIYGFLRRKSHGPEDAADLAQGFFASLLENNALARADRTKGRFRNFLLGALQRFLADESRRDGAQKRGRGKVVLAFDFESVEQSYLEESDPGLTPEQVYDRRWAATVLETAFAELQEEFREAGQVSRFDAMKRYLSEEVADGDYEKLGAQFGLVPKAVSSAVARLRERYRELVRRNVMATVAGAEDVDAEFRDLFR
jgi:RNA polymerase sigma-70 factor (ECF subfamily)